MKRTGNNGLLVKKLKEAGKKIVVVKRTIRSEGTTNGAHVVVAISAERRNSIKAAVGVLFGKIKPSSKTKLPIRLGDQQEAPVKKPVWKKGQPLDLSYC